MSEKSVETPWTTSINQSSSGKKSWKFVCGIWWQRWFRARGLSPWRCSHFAKFPSHELLTNMGSVGCQLQSRTVPRWYDNLETCLPVACKSSNIVAKLTSFFTIRHYDNTKGGFTLVPRSKKLGIQSTPSSTLLLNSSIFLGEDLEWGLLRFGRKLVSHQHHFSYSFYGVEPKCKFLRPTNSLNP